MNEFGKRLNLLRTRRDISLENLAEAVGSTKSLIWRYENGKSEPGLTALKNLANYFGVTLDWIAGNGEFNNIKFANKTEYCNAIDKCIKEDISPEKLERIIDVMKD